jgi:hypothetical protein
MLEQNKENPPAAIAIACQRQLEWIEDPKLRERVQQHIKTKVKEANK